MKPRQFLQRIAKGPSAAGYLFLGNEQYNRDRCRRALVQSVLGNANADETEGLTHFDLSEHSIYDLLDDARTLSLFATSRVIVGANAESALPRRIVSKAGPEIEALRKYFADPTSGVVILFEATRYDSSDRDDKTKIERVARFFAPVPERVELDRLSPRDVLSDAQTLAKRLELNIDSKALADLVEMLGADMARVAGDLEKLSLYAGKDGRITADEIELLIPEARQRGMYEFSDALAHRDRRRALDILDTLARSGEYWPMQINLLAGLLRHALIVKEEGLKSVANVSRTFQQKGLRMWPARAKQVLEISRQFTQEELEGALERLFDADRDLRRERPNDRVIMEELVVNLTSEPGARTPARRARAR
jgi:DNA polymerase-3 subunit delta